MKKKTYLSGLPLPDVAMSFNGEYLENTVPGYRTLSVEGRSPVRSVIRSITDYAVGERYQNRRREARTLKVSFVLAGTGADDLTASVDSLSAALSAEETQIIFADEEDKYYTGTVESVTAKSAGKNTVKGEIQIRCADPVKYSVEEKTVEEADGEFSFIYAGTHPACPVLEATAESDLGFVAYADELGHIIQIGDPDEVDMEEKQHSETLIDADFTSSMPSGWTANSAYTPSNRNPHVHTGTLKAGTASGNGLSVLGGGSYGSGTGWHGPTLTKALPADSSGHVGAANFTLSFWHFLTTASMNDMGGFWVSVEAGSGASRQNIASIVFCKSARGNNQSRAELCVRDKIMKTVYFDSSYWNPITGYPPSWSGYETHSMKQTNPGAGHSSIQKFGSKITFNLAGTSYVFDDPEAEELEAREVSVWFEQYGTEAAYGANVLRTLALQSHAVSSWEDIPNKFMDGDVITADTKDAVIRVNGVTEHGIGALGNDWETFRLMPGSNLISCMYSDFADKPVFRLRYREAYL